MHELSGWTITNDHGLELLGNTHTPEAPTGCAIILHGFKGYKDYGFIPLLASMLADRGVLVHRFNFSTSGMTNDLQTFARPDLFAIDSWTRQVDDVRCVLRAIRAGVLPGDGLPVTLVGHSRGGATAILAGGRHAGELGLASIATINAVDGCSRLDEETERGLLEMGHLFTESARTKQRLRINSSWLLEQLEEPAAHDVCSMAARAGVPMLVMHGDQDDAVDLDAGRNIATHAGVPLAVIEGSNHVLNTPNPADIGQEPSAALMFVLTNIQQLIECRTK